MLLVSFHGGTGGIDNVFGYDTATGALNTSEALQGVSLKKAELRALVYANSLLYVANGEKKASNILCFTPPAAGDADSHFSYAGQFLGPLRDGSGAFENSIAHPYAMEFDEPGAEGKLHCYVSNQDTNVVAKAAVAADFKTAAVKAGCRSEYLKGQTGFCPPGGCVYLDGTFVASQIGVLPEVAVEAANVPDTSGGLAASFAADPSDTSESPKQKVQNSVRDLAIRDGVLLVCDEPAKVLRLYALADGTYLGASAVLAASATHLAIHAGGLYVSAGAQLYWSALSSPLTAASLSFESVLSAPAKNKVGGVTFDAATGTAYVAFQEGTGTTGTGSIVSYGLGMPPAAPPVFGAGTVIASQLADTPEFLLFLTL